jgi:hypothetical protein
MINKRLQINVRIIVGIFILFFGILTITAGCWTGTPPYKTTKGAVEGTYYVVKGTHNLTAETTKTPYKIGALSTPAYGNEEDKEKQGKEGNIDIIQSTAIVENSNAKDSSNYEYTQDKLKQEKQERLDKINKRNGGKYFAKARSATFEGIPGQGQSGHFTLKEAEEFTIVNVRGEDSHPQYVIEFASGKLAYISVSEFENNLRNKYFRLQSEKASDGGQALTKNSKKATKKGNAQKKATSQQSPTTSDTYTGYDRDELRRKRDAMSPVFNESCHQGNKEACKQEKEWQIMRKY